MFELVRDLQKSFHSGSRHAEWRGVAPETESRGWNKIGASTTARLVEAVRGSNELLWRRVFRVPLDPEALEDAAHGWRATVVGLLQNLGFGQFYFVNVDPPLPDLEL